MTFNYKGHKFALEFDGPQHFAVNDPNHELGMTTIRNKSLMAMGYKVVALSYEMYMQKVSCMNSGLFRVYVLWCCPALRVAWLYSAPTIVVGWHCIAFLLHIHGTSSCALVVYVHATGKKCLKSLAHVGHQRMVRSNLLMHGIPRNDSILLQPETQQE